MTSATDTPTADACRAAVEKFYNSIATGSVETIMECFKPDAVVSLAGQLAMCGTYQGRERINEWGRQVFGQLDPSTMEAPKRWTIFAVDAPRVAAISENKATAKDGSLVYHPTYVQLFEIEDGQIAKFWEFADTAMLEQLFGNKLSAPQAGAGAPFVY